MAYLNRKIDAILRDWKASENHLPLVVRGARQVGKTASILEFARQSYENVVYVNFVEQPTYRQILADGYGTADVVRNLSRITPSFSFEPGTLLVFDEMQALPDIATTLKFFKLDGRFDVICSGSLLGLHYDEIESNSVGYKTDVTMQSMDFEEFLWAKGYDVSFTDDMLAHMVDGRPFSALEHRLLLRLFLDYCVLGGMPAVVRTNIESDTFEGTLACAPPDSRAAGKGKQEVPGFQSCEGGAVQGLFRLHRMAGGRGHREYLPRAPDTGAATAWQLRCDALQALLWGYRTARCLAR